MNRFQYENEIRNLIQKDNNCSAHFEWDKVKHPGKEYFTLRLNLITYNPVHSMHFLLHSICINKSMIEDEDYKNILKEMHQYLSKRQVCLYNYVIRWRLKASDKPTTCSYFQGINCYSDLDSYMFKYIK